MRRSFNEIGRGARISARAFTTPSQLKTVLVLPLMLLIFLVAALQRGIILAPDSQGVVFIRRHRPWATFVFVLVLVAIVLLAIVKALAAAQPVLLLGIAAVQFTLDIPLLIGVVVLLSSGGAQSATLVGRHTPKGHGGQSVALLSTSTPLVSQPSWQREIEYETFHQAVC